MTISGYLRVLRRRWPTLVLVTLLMIVIAGGVTALMPKSYVAQSTSFVSIAKGGGGDGSPDALYQNSQYALGQVQSYPAMVTSPRVLDPVIDDLGLSLTRGELRRAITVTNPVNTVLLEVQATSGSPTQARLIANAVATRLGKLIERLARPTGRANSPVQVTRAVPATTPTSPSSPRPVLNLGLGLLLGLALGAIAAVVRERRDTSVGSLEHLRTITGANALGSIRAQKDAEERPLLVATHSYGVVEDFRSIRTALRYVDVDRDSLRQVVITSATEGEGKSLVSCNLALTMARSGLHVCLVEGDLRRPRASSYLGLDGTVGLSEVVAGEQELDDALVGWHRGELTVLPSGATPPDPGALLASRATGDVLARLRERFDLVIIDAPPVLPVSDAGVLGVHSDGIILVARHGQVSRDQVGLAISELRTMGAHLIGTVLNATPVKERRRRNGPDYDRPAERPTRARADERSGSDDQERVSA